MRCLHSLALALPLTLFATAHADGGLFIGGKVSTLGAGGEIGLNLTENFAIRGSATGFSYEFSEELDGIDSDLELELGAIGVQLDLHPLGSGFFLSGGVFSNGNEIVTRAMPSEPVEIGDTVYQPAEIGVIEGVGSFDDPVGYIGIGQAFGGRRASWQFVIEAGAYMQGAPVITYTTTGLLADDPDFVADLEAEAASAQDDLERLDMYPVLSLGIRRQF